MAEGVGGGAGQPNLNLTPEEKRVYYQLFQTADKTNLGVVTGEVAVSFFERTGLPPDVLGQIWQIADTENRGLLTPSGFGIVLRLIGHAQGGRAPSEDLALQPGPLPKFEGLEVSSSIPRQTTGDPIAPQVTGQVAGPIRVPPLSIEDGNKFAGLFERSGSQGGIISGEQAKLIFEKARLPNEVLGRIWNLADSQQRGALDMTEFIIAMHLITSQKNGSMRGLPQTLPPGLYEAAARRGRPLSGSRPPPPAAAIPRQFSGQARTASPVPRQPPLARPFSPQMTGASSDWAVTLQDKANFDNIFATIDKSGRGYIDGEQALDFFSNARLSEDILAQIWDLADINSEGRLNKDEFAVAMYLIRQQRGLKDNVRGDLPPTLPANLIPPSMRRQVAPPSQPTAPAFDNAAHISQPKSAADDLFGLDVLTFPAPASAQIPMSTGGSNGPFQTPTSPNSRASPMPPSTFKPFIPSSAFGQSLAPQSTGLSQQASSAPKAHQASDDLLGDADPDSSKITSDSMELGNLSNQVSSLSTQMQEVTQKRAGTDQQISQVSQQKRDFEVRLAQLRAMYESEVRDVRGLEQQLSSLRSETQKLQQEMTALGTSYQEIQAQHQQLTAQLAAEKQENSSLKERTRQVNAEINKLKPQLEKLKSDARQQKGMVAINKKQLATSENEREKLRSDIDLNTKELEELRSSTPQNITTSAAAATLSPALSTASQNTNPFFRRTASQSPGPSLSPSQAREAPTDGQGAFDNVFGPSFSVPTTASAPPLPPTSFRTESPVPTYLSAQNTGFSANSFDPAPSNPFPNHSQAPISMANVSNEGPSYVSAHQSNSHENLTSSGMEAPHSQRITDLDRQGVQDNSGHPQAEDSSQQNSGSGAPGSGLGHLGGFSIFDHTGGNEHQDVHLETTTAPQQNHGAADISHTSSQLNGSDLDASWTAVSHENASSDHVPTTTATNVESATSPEADSQDVPGAFPPETPFGEDVSSPTPAVPRDESFDELFGGPAHKRSHSENVSDFDQAFAAMKVSNSSGPSNANTTGPSEFPPIQEIDDDSSSDSEVELGFDDDFASAGHAPSAKAALDGERSEPTPVGFEKNKDVAPAVDASAAPPSISDQARSPTANTTTPGSGLSNLQAFNFEDAFAGVELAEAKESDGEDDFDSSDFKTEFDPSFVSPAPSKSHTFDSSTYTAQPSTTSHDFFGFEETSGAPQITGQPEPSAAGNAGSSHDWDAMFSGLDARETTGDDSDDDKAAVGVAPLQSSLKPEVPSRPELGRALSGGTEHDDPILKRLTGMGYPREKALAALEKFDYNLDKAADHLTSEV